MKPMIAMIVMGRRLDICASPRGCVTSVLSAQHAGWGTN
jgi:hypothetical protein